MRSIPLLLTLVACAAAIFLLLPRPRAFPVAFGALCGTAALLLTGGLLIRAHVVTPEVILFYAFSAIAIVAGVVLLSR